MKTTKPEKTIAQLFEEFLADQKPRISHKTYMKYESIIDLYGSYLENYWPGHDGESSKTQGGRHLLRHASALKMPRPGTANSSATSCPGRSCAARKRCKPLAPSRRSWRSGWPKKATSRTPRTTRSEREKPPRICPMPVRGRSARCLRR